MDSRRQTEFIRFLQNFEPRPRIQSVGCGAGGIARKKWGTFFGVSFGVIVQLLGINVPHFFCRHIPLRF